MLRTILQVIGIVGVAFIVTVVFYSGALKSLNPTALVYKKEMDPTAFTAATSQASEPEVVEAVIEEPEESEIPEPSQSIQSEAIPSENTAQNQVATVKADPYPFPPHSNDTLNTETRNALVNILCRTSGTMVRPISGSGVLIDPRGIILTNAHVAQYVLLASQPEVSLSCVIRTGSPAVSRWEAEILYMPSAWVQEHAADIKKTRPLGTGENDYALLRITKTIDGTPLPDTFPYLSVETRQNIHNPGDKAFLAAYPAEFSAGNATQNSLNASSAFSIIRQLLTFNENTVDLISVGGIVLAQSGSSGGAAVNEWGRLIGIISTTSEGETTAERDLRAITLSYINRSLIQHTGQELYELLTKDPASQARQFMQNDAPKLAKLIIDQLSTQ